jgi:hypothetical protein
MGLCLTAPFTIHDVIERPGILDAQLPSHGPTLKVITEGAHILLMGAPFTCHHVVNRSRIFNANRSRKNRLSILFMA